MTTDKLEKTKEELKENINSLIEEEIENRFEFGKEPTLNTSKILILQEIRYAIDDIETSYLGDSVGRLLEKYKDNQEALCTIVKATSNTSIFDVMWEDINSAIEDSINFSMDVFKG